MTARWPVQECLHADDVDRVMTFQSEEPVQIICNDCETVVEPHD